ncbi:Transcriptional regulator, MarR family [Serinicoccus hydrothermalis]|uniref:Transcriptional regulator, MarR family n=1 Tax=Serinicoccus hydrothermalis TaxID=1758689 RepID=A0A1B1NBN0_9MICO|nr:MarR family transcriptional regulator [Serinicoccus hydrothermalis]ANS78804.1 Transcriptional regulator, MarR family [Serinicoccus hydrothermalis]
MNPSRGRSGAASDEIDEPTEVDLLQRLARRWRHAGRPDAARDGLSPHQERALLAVTRLTDRTERPGVRVSALAEHLDIAPRSATEVADALETAGLLTRRPDPDDRRAVLLTPTPAARHTVEQVRERRRAAAGRAVAALDPADRAELRRLLLLLLAD